MVSGVGLGLLKGGGGGGGSPCVSGSVSLSGVRNCNIAFFNLKNTHFSCHFPIKTHVACH